MTEMKFTDRAAMAGTRRTADGYLVGHAKCARTGCQQYMASDLGLPGGGVVNVYRPEDVVFAKDSMATFAGKPVTMGHPASGVTAENWRQLAVGDIGTEVARDGEFVVVPYKIMDGAAIAAIEATDGPRELSMGYSTGVEIRDGVAPDGTRYQAVQTGPIRINHLAVVPVARGGNQLRLGDGTGDGAAHWGASPLTSDGKEIGMADPILKTVVLGDQAVQVAATDAHTIEAFKVAAAKELTDAIAAKDAAIAAKDVELATKDAKIVALEAKVLTDAALDKLVADRADLIAKAKTIADGIVTDGKSAGDIKRATVIAKSGAAMADKSAHYIDAAFDLLADAAKVDPARAALADAAGKAITTGMPAVYESRNKALNDAWKGEAK